MCIFDIIILGFVAIGLIIGLFHGFFKELVGTVGLVVAIMVANWVAPTGRSWVAGLVNDDTAAMVLAWILVFIICMVCMSGLAYLLGKLMNAVCLGWLNRLAGGALGAVKYFMLVALLVCLFNILCDKFEGFVLEPYIRESALVPDILRISEAIWQMF